MVVVVVMVVVAVVATRAALGHGRDVSPPARKSRTGVFALLAVLVALVGAYLGNCFQGLGLSAGDGRGAKQVQEGAAKAKKAVGEAAAKARVTVEGERCRLGDEASPRGCDAVCRDLSGGAAEIEATAGAQRTVDTLRSCLQGRGVKVTVLAD